MSLTRFDAARRRRLGIDLLAGVDEAGRGPLAGPVVAACVVLRPGTRLPGVDDSKVLSHEEREALAPLILQRAESWGLGWANAAEIDRVNILQATHLAAGRAMAMLHCTPQHMITDYLFLKTAPCPVEAIAQGDARSQAVAAASVLAKVARDRIMTALHREYPYYYFDTNKGYGTAQHWQALRSHGPSTLHRLTFRGVVPEETFFSEPEPVKAVRAQSAAIPEREKPAGFCWKMIMETHAAALNPLAFLPEAEWA